jgi:hypothetical protein
MAMGTTTFTIVLTTAIALCALFIVYKSRMAK